MIDTTEMIEPADTREHQLRGLESADKFMVGYRFRAQLMRIRVHALQADAEETIEAVIKDIAEFALDCYEDGFEDGLDQAEGRDSG
jgi:hypothetical protein